MKRVELLDYARLLAAVAVMAFHYLFNGINNGKLALPAHDPVVQGIAKYGYLGVEFFFIISGFVIAYSYAGKTPGQFLASRTVRLFPAWWAAILFTSAVSWTWGTGDMVVSLPRLAANFMIVPQVFGQPFVDGVYWTLLYECAFYALIFGMMLIGLRDRLPTFFLLWPWAMLLASLAGLEHVPFLGSYYTFFATGAVFAGRAVWPARLRLPTLVVAGYLCVRFTIANAAKLGAIRHVDYDPVVVGGAMTIMLLLFALLDWRAVRDLRLPGSRWAGAITYPLYLIHAHVGYMILSRFGDRSHPVASTLLMMTAVIAAAALLHQVFERRPAAWWKLVFARLVGQPVDAVAGAILRGRARLSRQRA